MIMTITGSRWKHVAALAARLILAAVFLMAASFEAVDFQGTASTIALAGFPLPGLCAVAAAILEVAIAISMLTQRLLAPIALIGAAYVLFLGVTFHGPSQWQRDHREFVIFIDHFIFVAGLLLAATSSGTRTLVRSD